MTWAEKRQAVILAVFIFIVLIVGSIILKPIIAPAPTCSDGRQNGAETGVDCGGTCIRACVADVIEPVVSWARPFKVADGVYSAVAFVSNPNAFYVATSVPYVMKLYDEKNVLLAERDGVVDIPPKSSFPVFEGAISIGKANVHNASFYFPSTPNWQKYRGELSDVNISAPNISDDIPPKITATVRNDGARTIYNLPVVIIIYNKDGNAIASSETIVYRLDKNQSSDISYTWLLPFSDQIGRVEFYPIIRP